MNWWQPLLDYYNDHLHSEHQDQGHLELSHGYNMMEQHLMYERFYHANDESISCDFCKWRMHFTINFDLLTKGADE